MYLAAMITGRARAYPLICLATAMMAIVGPLALEPSRQAPTGAQQFLESYGRGVLPQSQLANYLS